MTDDDRDMTNAALLLDEKITERILGCLSDSRVASFLWDNPDFVTLIRHIVISVLSIEYDLSYPTKYASSTGYVSTTGTADAFPYRRYP